MPQWIPKSIPAQLALEEKRKQLERIQRGIAPPWTPEEPAIPTLEQQQWMPTQPNIPQPQQVVRNTPVPQDVVPTPIIRTKAEKTEVPEVTPFWQRALQIFAAPFNWVDETIIKPGLALGGTATGIVPELEREAGEDFFDWKKRSWEAWEAPGIDIKVPWGDGDWRVDVKGLAEFAPWLAIPGAQGIGGAVGRLGKVGQIAGKAIQYSPWGLAEKGISTAFKAGLSVTGKVSEKVGEKVFGKIERPPLPESIQKFKAFVDDAVVPQRMAFEKELPALRRKQEALASEWLAKGRRGEISMTEAVQNAAKARAVGSLKEQFAVKPGSKFIPEVTDISLNDEKILTPIYELMGGNEGRLFNNLIKYQTRNTEGYHKLLQQVAEQMDSNPELKTVLLNSLRKKGLPDEFMVYHGGGEKKAFGKYTNVTFDKDRAAWFAEQIPNGVVYSYKVKLRDIVGIGDPSVGELFVKSSSLATTVSRATSDWLPEYTDDLLLRMAKASETGLATTDSSNALLNLLTHGTPPEPHHLKEFARVFGDEFAKSIYKLRSARPSALERFTDVFNIPRSVLASGDISGVARQGLILGVMHPTVVPKSFWRMFKSLFSEKMALQMDDVLKAMPDTDDFIRHGGYISPISKTARAAVREEAFISPSAERIPFVRRSERAFITYLNELKVGSYKAAKNAWVAQGAGDAELKVLARFINLASGRGDLPFSIEKYAPLMNAVLFSPRKQLANLQLPRQIGRMLLSKNPYMRKEAARALVTFVGGGTALITLLAGMGKAKTELDPRSADFGKIMIGETRLDIWTGYIQYARFIAQMLSGESKSAYGNLSKKDRFDTAFRFVQSKSSPAFGLFVDLLKGENYQGEPLFQGTTGVIKQAKDRLFPLALQDVMDAMEQSGVNGIWTAAPASLGIGTLTYVNDLVKIRERIAREEGFETWDEIDPKKQREIQNRSMELQAAELQFDRRVMGTAWGDWRLAGNAVEENFTDDVNQAVAQFRETQDGLQFREKISDAFTKRRGGYDARERDERFSEIVRRFQIKDTAEALLALSPEQLAVKVYNDALYGDDMYDEFGDYRFDEAKLRKEQLRASLGEELFKYVEDFQGLKYETLPPEFQELQRAKEILRPYWEVQDWVVQNYGKPFADGKRGQALISKLRKNLRRQNPDMEQAINLFYRW